MGDLKIGQTIAQTDQTWDANITIAGEGQKFGSVGEAQAHADSLAASGTQDAVILRRGDEFVVYPVNEVRTAAGTQRAGDLPIHDLSPPGGFTVVGFSVSNGGAANIARIAPEKGTGSDPRIDHAMGQLSSAGLTKLEIRMLAGGPITKKNLEDLAARMERSAEQSTGALGGIAAMRCRGLQEVFTQAAQSLESDGAMSFNQLVFTHLSSNFAERARLGS